MFRFLTVLLIAMAVSVPAQAARVFVGIGVPFFPFYFGAPAYYYPPAAYYPPSYYYSPPAYYAPQSAPAAYSPDTVAPASARNCRDYRGDATIDGSRKPFYGRACLESDGKWHVVN